MHGFGMVLGGDIRLGDDCCVYQGVTIGTDDPQAGLCRYPVVGDRVVTYAGAKVVGGVEVGNGANIGASAVVIRDVPAGATMVGVPIRYVRLAGNRIAA
jgi:serine O-acetyltransferase